MSKLIAIAGNGPREEKAVDAERLVEGSPRTVSTLDYERDDKVFAGEWSAGVGAWRVKYDEWEFCHVLEGVCELVPDGGEAVRYSEGDSFIIRAWVQRRLARHRADEEALRRPLRLNCTFTAKHMRAPLVLTSRLALVYELRRKD